MVQRCVLQCGLCRNKEKCLKPDLKCVNRWSSSTVQRKRVPESWSGNRETTSSSVPSSTNQSTEGTGILHANEQRDQCTKTNQPLQLNYHNYLHRQHTMLMPLAGIHTSTDILRCEPHCSPCKSYRYFHLTVKPNAFKK